MEPSHSYSPKILTEKPNLPNHIPNKVDEFAKVELSAQDLATYIRHEAFNNHFIFTYPVAAAIKKSDDVRPALEAIADAIMTFESKSPIETIKRDSYLQLREMLEPKKSEAAAPLLTRVFQELALSLPTATFPTKASKDHPVYSISKTELESTYVKLLDMVEDICGASVTLPDSNLSWKRFGKEEFNAVLNSLVLHGDALLTRCLQTALHDTVVLLKGDSLNYSCIPSVTPEDCYEAVLKYLQARSDQDTTDSRYQVETVGSSKWLKLFEASTQLATEQVQLGLAAISETKLQLLDKRFIVILDDESDKVARLEVIPKSISNLEDNNILAERQVSEGKESSVRSLSLKDLLKNKFPDKTLQDFTVEEYIAVLPTYPNQGKVEFLVELPRESFYQQVLISTGDGPCQPFHLMPKNNPRIKDPLTKEFVPVGAPHSTDTSKEAPFTARTLETLTAGRKDRLLNEIGLKESTSIVIVLIPLKVILPKQDLFKNDFEPVMRSLSMPTRSLHTGLGLGTTGANYQTSADQMVVDRDGQPKVLVFHAAGLPA